MTNNNKISLLLYGDSRFDQNKNKFILQLSKKYKNNLKVLWVPF